MYRPGFLAVLLLLVITFISVATIAASADPEVRLALNNDDSVKTGHPGEVTGFQLTLFYDGAQATAWIQMILVDEPSNWTHHIYGSSSETAWRESPVELWLILVPGETAPVHLNLTPALRALAGRHDLSMIARVQGEEHLNHALTVTVAIPKVTQASVKFVNTPKDGHSANPGTEAKVTVEVNNTGNHEDVYEVVAKLTAPPDGWGITGTKGIMPTGATLPVAAFSTYQFTVIVGVPGDAMHMDACELSVKVTSTEEPHGNVKTLLTTVSADQLAALTIEVVSGADQEIFPREDPELEVGLWVTNTGNGVDIVTSHAEMVGWAEGVVVTVGPDQVELLAGESAAFTVHLRAPADLPRGLYVILVRFNTTREDVHRDIEVGFHVGQYFAIELTSQQPRQGTVLGGILDFEVSVCNAGNGLDSITIGLRGVPAGWLTYIQPPEVSLLQGQDSMIQIRVIVPSRFEKAPQERYDLTVKAISTRSGVSASFVIRIDLAKFYRVEWVYQARPITDPDAPEAQQDIIRPRMEVNPAVDDRVFTILEVENFGNTNVNVSFSTWAGEPSLAVTLSKDRMFLPPGGTGWISVGVDIDPAMAPGYYPFRVSLTVDEAPNYVVRIVPLWVAVYTIDVAVRSPLNLTGVGLRRGAEGGFEIDEMGTVRLVCSIESVGSVLPSNCTVRFDHVLPNGTREMLDEAILTFSASIDAFERRYTWTAIGAGEHTLEVRVLLDGQIDTANDVANVTIDVLEVAPSGREADGQGLAIMAVIAISVVAAVALLGRLVAARGRA